MIQYSGCQLPISQNPFSSQNNTQSSTYLWPYLPQSWCFGESRHTLLWRGTGQSEGGKKTTIPTNQQGAFAWPLGLAKEIQANEMPGLVCWGRISGKDTFSIFFKELQAVIFLYFWPQGCAIKSPRTCTAICLLERSQPENEVTLLKSEQRDGKKLDTRWHAELPFLTCPGHPSHEQIH